MKRNGEKEQKDSSREGGGGRSLVDITEYMDESSLKKRARERLEVIIGSFPIFYIFNSFALETFM